MVMDTNMTANATVPSHPTSEARSGDIALHLVGFFSSILISNLLLLRIQSIRRTARTFRQLSIIHVLVFVIFGFALTFVTSSQLLYFGIGITDGKDCRTAILLCAVFYIGQKFALYIFLVERTVVAQNVAEPRKTVVYLLGMSLVLGGFGAIGIAAFAVGLASNYDDHAECRIGIRRPVAIALLSWDILVNLFLTFVFLFFIREFLVDGMAMALFPEQFQKYLKRWRGEEDHTSSSGGIVLAQRRLVSVIRKSFWGSVAILVTTVANFGIVLYLVGREYAWVCFFLCTLDICWAGVVIFWLTAPVGDVM